MKYAFIDSSNIVHNIIEYDGTSPIVPPAGTSLAQINTWVNIGQHIDAPQSLTIPQSYYDALVALDKSDTTMLRINEAVSLQQTTLTTPDVVAFIEYRRQLRAIVSSKSGSLPNKPSYPVGT